MPDFTLSPVQYNYTYNFEYKNRTYIPSSEGLIRFMISYNYKEEAPSVAGSAAVDPIT